MNKGLAAAQGRAQARAKAPARHAPAWLHREWQIAQAVGFSGLVIVSPEQTQQEMLKLYPGASVVPAP